MDGDRPIKLKEEDRLGFSPVAEHLAKVIVDQAAKDGLVFGVEGQWGSGKSTLINLTVDALKRHTSNPPEIIEFSPWLVGSRDDLLIHLFEELATAACRIEPVEDEDELNPKSWYENLKKRLFGHAHYRLTLKKRLKEKIGQKLEAFGKLAGGISKVVKASGAAGLPYGEAAGGMIERTGELAKGLFASTSIVQQKSEIVAALKLLSRRIVVFVDDLDRLEPREASEVLRLIRAVADFPNVIYVLSYDSEVVAKTLTKAVQVDNGAAFLEKIVQVSFRVPRPEAFDLRRWFHDEVNDLFKNNETGLATLPLSTSKRLAEVIDVHGGRFLQKPRDVVRALNSLKLHAVPVRDNIDIADMVWLQLIRLGSPDYYNWIEEYLTEASAVFYGAGISDESAMQMGQRLDNILRQKEIDSERERFDLARLLPGISVGFVGKKDQVKYRVFNNLSQNAFHDFIEGRRLGSPEHYRFYFAFAQPAGALGDDQVNSFIQLAEKASESAVNRFADLSKQLRPQGGVKAELLIERLLSAIDRVPPTAVRGIVSSFANSLDTLALSSRDGDFGQHRVWDRAERAVKLLLKKISPVERAECIRQLFAEGAAIGWITSIFRNETFAHGHYGDRAEPEDQRLLSKAEFDGVVAIMMKRYASASPAELMRAPNLISLLYGWKQGSGTEDARHWVEANTQTDDQLVTFLERSRGWSASSDIGVHYPLNQRDLKDFLDFDAALQRVKDIAGGPNSSPGLRDRATELLVAFGQGQR